MDATLQLKGTDSLDQPVRIQASGPFRTNEGKFPSADLELRIGSSGGQTIQTGFLSTGDRAFVKFEDVYYEQPASQVRQANRAISKAGGRGSLRSLGLNPRTGWPRPRRRVTSAWAAWRPRTCRGRWTWSAS